VSAEVNQTVSMEDYCELIGPVNPSRQNILTLNNRGSAYCFKTYLSEAFLEYCRERCQNKHVFEVGCAYGIKSSQIVQTGALLLANDLNEYHIEMMRNAFSILSKRNSKFSNVSFLVKNIIDLDIEELEVKKFEAILVESVLHFMTPEEIQIALEKFHSLLEDNGRVYIMVSSPFLKYLVEAYEKNKENNEPWPGYFVDPEDIHPMNSRLSKPYHAFDEETMLRELTLADFHVIESGYIKRPHQEHDMALDGREGLFIIAEKRPPNNAFIEKYF
jgi:SAM-dependent methyltransferase